MCNINVNFQLLDNLHIIQVVSNKKTRDNIYQDTCSPTVKFVNRVRSHFLYLRTSFLGGI